MKEFVFSYPAKVYFGEDSLEKAIAAECRKYGRTVMFAYGGAFLKKNGIYDRVKGLLKKEGKKVVDFQAHQIGHQLGAFMDGNHGQVLAVIHPAY